VVAVVVMVVVVVVVLVILASAWMLREFGAREQEGGWLGAKKSL
jgi:hypothetical protein